jgi:predicted MFS family arabinose efflux permease
VIEALLALYGLTILLSGPFVNRLGGRFSGPDTLRLGEGLKLVGLLLLGFSPGHGWPIGWQVTGLAIGQVLSGFGYALTSGVEASLVPVLEPDRTAAGRIQASTQSWIFAVVLISGVSGAVVFNHARIAVFLMSVAACALAIVALIPLHVPPREGGGRKTGQPLSLDGVRTWIAYYVAIRAVALACFVGFFPYLLFVRVKVSLAFFGLLLALFNLAAFIIARYSAQLIAALGRTAVLCGTLAAVAGALLLALSRNSVAVSVALVLLGLGAGAARPLTQSGLSILPVERRQPVSVRMEQINGLVNALLLALGGLLLQHAQVTPLLVGSAVVVVLVGAVLVLSQQRTAVAEAGTATAPAPVTLGAPAVPLSQGPPSTPTR